MSTVPTPNTPSADAANDHDINDISEDEILQLDLNPDLDDTDDVKMEEDNEDAANGNSLKRTFIDDQIDNAGFDDMEDFQPVVDLKSPFESYSDLQQAPQKSAENGQHTHQARRLSLSQQSKFVAYIDNELLQIQRKFVQSRGLNVSHGYNNLSEVLHDFKKLVDFIWYSIDGISNTDSLLQEDLDDSEIYKRFEGSQSTNFGQSYYLIRIADDLLDFLDKFPLTDEEENGDLEKNTENADAVSSNEPNLRTAGSNDSGVPGTKEDVETTTPAPLRKLFKMLSILDNIFARLIDGKVPGNFKLSGTEIVRLIGIAERTRILLPRLMEKNDIHGYHYEISRVYLETLERGT